MNTYIKINVKTKWSTETGLINVGVTGDFGAGSWRTV